MAIVRAPEASSSDSRYSSYHVFLSFRGKDTRKTFTGHLYTALVHAGFRTFRDDDEIERGKNIKLELQKAIRESRISIVVFSKDYASSSWCLDELVMILKRRRTTGHVVLPVFYHVDPSDVRKLMGSFKEAFTSHEERFQAEAGERKDEWMGKVKGWKAALKEAADLAGMNSQNQADGLESKFIQKIVKVVGDKLSRTILGIDPHLVGIHSRAKNIKLWLQDESSDVGMVAICGMGGIGKTTIAKFLYNSYFSRFEGSSFLGNVREKLKQHDGLLRLQKQLLSDISKGRKEKLYNVDEGKIKIKDALCCKRALVVLDDVDTEDQLDAVLGMRDWLFQGSKIIITTRREQLLKAHEVFQVHKISNLTYGDSLELFSWHAFGQICPIDGFIEVSERVVHHCGGLPLALKILGASLSGKSLNVWESQLEKLKAIPNNKVFEILKISYDSLQDDHDKDLFLHIACFFVGKDKDWVITVLDGCNFYTMIGFQNLIDRCLLTINGYKELEMHQLFQEMGREIVRQESVKEPGERSRLWNHKDSFNVLRENTGTRKIEGLILDMNFLKEAKFDKTVFGLNRKRHFEEFLDTSFLSDKGNSFKRHCFGIFSWQAVGTIPGNSNEMALEVDAFSRMPKLKLLHLNHVQVNGNFKNFPKGLRWLCWHRFPFNCTHDDFSFNSLAVLEMSYSNLQKVWKGTKFLPSLKILDLSYSHCLAETPNFSNVPNLEKLIFKNCVSLVEVHESIGYLQRLVLLNFEDCKNLRKLPRSIGMLKVLETLDISGCSNLEELPTEMGTMESLTKLHANGIDMSRLGCTTKEVKPWYSFIWPSRLMPRKNIEIPWAFLPRSLVKLSLVHCNLSDDVFPRDLSNLSSLHILNLGNNPICNFPDCIRFLTGLKELSLEKCTGLHSIIVPQNLLELNFAGCTSLEKIICQSLPLTIEYDNECGNLFSRKKYQSRSRRSWDCKNLVDSLGEYKLEPIGNVDIEIIKNLGLSNLGSMGSPNVMVLYWEDGHEIMRPLQGYHDAHIFCVYLPGSKVPAWFDLKNIGSSISFTVPSHLNFRIRGLSVCSIYAISNDRKYHDFYLIEAHTIISNTTKSLIWSHSPSVIGIPEAEEDMMWLSYWKFENQLEDGDELNISVAACRSRFPVPPSLAAWGSEDSFQFQVKEVGVHLVYEEEQEEKSSHSQSTSEEEAASQQFSFYGNVVPGDASAVHPANKKVYQLGRRHYFCSICYELGLFTGRIESGLPLARKPN